MSPCLNVINNILLRKIMTMRFSMSGIQIDGY